MGIFNKKKEDMELPKLEPMEEPKQRRVTAYEVQHKAHSTQKEIIRLLDDYRTLIGQGESLSIARYEELIAALTATAQEFEKIYQLMKFDMEKAMNIQKYHEDTLKKREELMNMLNEEENKKETPEEPPKSSKK